MRIVPRSEWGAREPRARTTIRTPTPKVYLHHSGGNEHGPSGVRAIQRYHMDTRDYNDIAYSFLVDNADGVIYEGRGAGVAGGHTEGQNSVSHAICVMGNFEVIRPSDAALAAVSWLYRHGISQGWWQANLLGHKDAPGSSTACPGRNLYAYIPQIRQAAYTTPPPAPTGGTVTVNVHVLRRGNTGGQVKALQSLLNGKAGQGLLIDGSFGAATENAVKNVQRFFRLTADGVVGANTWGVLFL